MWDAHKKTDSWWRDHQYFGNYIWVQGIMIHSDISNTCHKWLRHTAAATYNNGKTIASTWGAFKLYWWERKSQCCTRSIEGDCQWVLKKEHTPQLCSLPPTTEKFGQIVLWAHLQLAQWYAALEKNPFPPNPEEFGRVTDHTNRILSPRMVVGVPEQILKLMRCGYDW